MLCLCSARALLVLCTCWQHAGNMLVSIWPHGSHQISICTAPHMLHLLYTCSAHDLYMLATCLQHAGHPISICTVPQCFCARKFWEGTDIALPPLKVFSRAAADSVRQLKIELEYTKKVFFVLYHKYDTKKIIYLVWILIHSYSYEFKKEWQRNKWKYVIIYFRNLFLNKPFIHYMKWSRNFVQPYLNSEKWSLISN